jgi:chitinase
MFPRRNARILSALAALAIFFACSAEEPKSLQKPAAATLPSVPQLPAPVPPPRRPEAPPMLAVYWGQNGYSAVEPTRLYWEKSLADTCRTKHYDIVILAFATQLTHGRNDALVPEMNFASHCHESLGEANPYLLRCGALAEGVRACQGMGKKVLLSVGGAHGSTGFTGDADATQAAQATWDLFLGGASPLRPFGAAVLDGIDLDLEAGDAKGVGAYVRALRQKMDASGHAYLLTGAPQCPYPDGILGPAPGLPLGDAPHAFDYLFVQFYNNKGCGGGSVAAVEGNFTRWAELVKEGGPRIFVGLPAAPRAAMSGYLQRVDLADLVSGLRNDAAFAGVMLWEASFDQNSAEASGTYGAFAKALLR